MISSFISVLFFTMNPFGNLPIIIEHIGHLPKRKQKIVICRELFFTFLILLISCMFGKALLSTVGIETNTMRITGGIILFVIGLHLLFGNEEKDKNEMKEDPFLIPLAFPLLAGPGAITVVMSFTHHGLIELLSILGSVLIVCLSICGIYLLAPPFIKFLGSNGLKALKKIGSLLILLIATEMIIVGIKNIFLT